MSTNLGAENQLLNVRRAIANTGTAGLKGLPEAVWALSKILRRGLRNRLPMFLHKMACLGYAHRCRAAAQGGV